MRRPEHGRELFGSVRTEDFGAAIAHGHGRSSSIGHRWSGLHMMQPRTLSCSIAAFLLGAVVAQPGLITSAIAFNARVSDVAVDELGNAYVTGFMQEAATFGTTVLPLEPGAPYDGFVAKLSPDGAWLWARRFGSANGMDMGLAIAVRPSGGIVVAAGVAQGTQLTYHDQALTNPLEDALLLLRLNTNGELVEHALAPGGLPERMVMTVGHDGTCYVGGVFQGPQLDFGGTVAMGPHSGFLAALGPSGTWSWSHGFQSPYFAEVTDLVIDQGGDLVALGDFTGPSMIMGDHLFNGYPIMDDTVFWTLFVLKCDHQGNVLWSKQSGVDEGMSSTASHLARLPNGNYRVSGIYHQMITLDGLTLGAPSSSFLAELSPVGVWLGLDLISPQDNVSCGWAEDPVTTLGNGDQVRTAGTMPLPVLIDDWSFQPGAGPSAGIMHYDGTGQLIAAQAIPSEGISVVHGLSSGPTRTLCFGQFRGETTFGPTTLFSPTEISFIAEIGTAATGVGDVLEEGRAIRLFPVPASTVCTLELPGHTGSSPLWIIQANGAVLHATVLVGERMELDIADLPAGVHLVKVGGTVARLVKE
jgi:hypothetical protein